jgi:hypothetical protein
MKKICITLLSQPKTSLSARGLKTQGDIGQGLTPSDMDLAMFYSFYHIHVYILYLYIKLPMTAAM